MPSCYNLFDAPVAQRIERGSPKAVVVGSTPAWGAHDARPELCYIAARDDCILIYKFINLRSIEIRTAWARLVSPSF